LFSRRREKLDYPDDYRQPLKLLIVWRKLYRTIADDHSFQWRSSSHTKKVEMLPSRRVTPKPFWGMSFVSAAIHGTEQHCSERRVVDYRHKCLSFYKVSAEKLISNTLLPCRIPLPTKSVPHTLVLLPLALKIPSSSSLSPVLSSSVSCNF